MLLRSIGLALISCALIHATPIKMEEASGDVIIEASGMETGSGIETSGIEISGSEESGMEISGSEASGIENGQFSGEESGASGFEDIMWSLTDCPRLLDGNYRLSPCNHRFLSCSNGLSYLMDCPAGLLYNAALDQCDWPHNIVGCEGDASGEELSDMSGSGIEASGDFSGTSSEFAIESSGATRKILVDASGNVISIIEASGVIIEEEESGSGSGLGSGEEESGSGSGLESGERTFEVFLFTVLDCRALPDGLYSLTACDHRYISCRAGLPSIRHCSPNHFYSPSLERCAEAHSIGCTGEGQFSGSGDLVFIDPSFSGFSGEESGLSGEESGFSGELSGEESGFSGEYSGFSGEESGLGSGEFSGMSGDFPFFSASDCTALPNGNYPMSACSSQFLSCSNNLPHVMDCPFGLLYNWAIDACDWPSNLGCDVESSGLDGSGSGESSGLYGSGSGDLQQPSCASESGSFSVGPCLAIYVKCVDGTRFEMSCEAGSVFSDSHKECVSAASIQCPSTHSSIFV